MMSTIQSKAVLVYEYTNFQHFQGNRIKTSHTIWDEGATETIQENNYGMVEDRKFIIFQVTVADVVLTVP